MISGTYRDMHQLNKEEFELEIYDRLRARIPLESIESYERLRGLPF